ncbi:MAG: Rrf2 family transcriptional regulator [Campylobacterota bacterium]|nr:Rrf2 family transcriptional regulator [Campylobacterota bacterium]
MLITKASEYALLSLIIIAKSNKPLDSETLSSELKISKSFLAKILQKLARDGILKSFKGVNGGFSLNQKPSDLTLLHVMNSSESKTPSVFECATSVESCPSNQADSCAIWPTINKLQTKIDTFLSDITLENILEE